MLFVCMLCLSCKHVIVRLDIISVLFAQFLKANEMIHLISKILSECLQERQSMHTNNISIKKKGNTISETINSAYIRKDIHRSLFSLATDPVRIRKSVLVSEEKYIKNNNTF